MNQGGIMYKSIAILFVLLVVSLSGLNSKLIASDSQYTAERGGDRNFDRNRSDFNHNDFNRGDFNHNNMDQGALYGANRGAAYGAAYGAAAGSNSQGVPVNPNTVEQNALYYGGVNSMEQGH